MAKQHDSQEKFHGLNPFPSYALHKTNIGGRLLPLTHYNAPAVVDNFTVGVRSSGRGETTSIAAQLSFAFLS